MQIFRLKMGLETAILKADYEITLQCASFEVSVKLQIFQLW